MIRACLALIGEHFLRKRAKAAAHAVADNGVTNFFGDGDAKADCRAVVSPVPNQQNKTGSCISLPPVGGQKVLPFFDNAVTAHVAVRLLGD